MLKLLQIGMVKDLSVQLLESVHWVFSQFGFLAGFVLLPVWASLCLCPSTATNVHLPSVILCSVLNHISVFLSIILALMLSV